MDECAVPKNYKALITIEPLFKKLGIGKDDKVISIPDPSINGTLYYMNRKGYTDFGSDFSNADGFYQRIEDGAKYLIVNDTTSTFERLSRPVYSR